MDTYTSLDKQYLMMTAILGFYDRAVDALQKGLDIDTVVALPARERIGRLIYAPEEQAADEFSHCMAMLEEEIRQALESAAEEE